MEREESLASGSQALGIPVVAMWLCLGVLPLFLLGGCGEEPIPSAPETAGGLEWSARRHDFGTLSDDETAEGRFVVTNRSSGPIRMTQVKASCSCLRVEPIADAIGPGSKAELIVTFVAKSQQGSIKKFVTVTLDNGEDVILDCEAVVNPWVRRSPAGLGFGEVRVGTVPNPKELIIEGRRAGFSISGVETDGPWSVQEKGREDLPGGGSRYTYAVALTSSGVVQTVAHTLVFSSTEPTMSSVRVTVTAQVVGPIRVVPDRVVVHTTQENETFEKTLAVTRRDAGGTPFRVTSVEVVAPPALGLSAELIAPGGPEWTIKVRGRGGVTHERVDASIQIRTTLPEEPLVVVPLSVQRIRTPK